MMHYWQISSVKYKVKILNIQIMSSLYYCSNEQFEVSSSSFVTFDLIVGMKRALDVSKYGLRNPPKTSTRSSGSSKPNMSSSIELSILVPVASSILPIKSFFLETVPGTSILFAPSQSKYPWSSYSAVLISYKSILRTFSRLQRNGA